MQRVFFRIGIEVEADESAGEQEHERIEHIIEQTVESKKHDQEGCGEDGDDFGFAPAGAGEVFEKEERRHEEQGDEGGEADVAAFTEGENPEAVGDGDDFAFVVGDKGAFPFAPAEEGALPGMLGEDGFVVDAVFERAGAFDAGDTGDGVDQVLTVPGVGGAGDDVEGGENHEHAQGNRDAGNAGEHEDQDAQEQEGEGAGGFEQEDGDEESEEEGEGERPGEFRHERLETSGEGEGETGEKAGDHPHGIHEAVVHKNHGTPAAAALGLSERVGMEAVDDAVESGAHDHFVKAERDIDEGAEEEAEAEVFHGLPVLEIDAANEVRDAPLDAASEEGVEAVVGAETVGEGGQERCRTRSGSGDPRGRSGGIESVPGGTRRCRGGRRSRRR